MPEETLDYLSLEEKFNLQESVFVFSVPELVKGSKEEFIDPGIDLITKLKKSGVKVLTPRDIDFSKLKTDEERVKLREKLGGIFIIPSNELLKENKDLVKFLTESKGASIDPPPVAKAIFFLSDHSQAKNIEFLSKGMGHDITAMSLFGGYDDNTSRDVLIVGQETFTRFISFFKEKRLQKK